MARRKAAKGRRRTRRVARRTTRRRPARRARPRRNPARKTRRVRRSTRKGQPRRTARRAYTRRNPKPFWMNPSVEPVLFGTVGIGIGYAVDSSGFAAPLTTMIPWENPNIGSIVVGLGTAFASNRFLKGAWKRRGIALGIGCAVGPWSIGMIQETTAGLLTKNGNGIGNGNGNGNGTSSGALASTYVRTLPLKLSAPTVSHQSLAAAAISGGRILS
jgi:hypothetical protein